MPRRKPLTVDDDGRRMTLREFDRWPTKNDFPYDLAHGVVQFADTEPPTHGLQIQAFYRQLVPYQLSSSSPIHYVGGRMEAKLMIETVQSERHPDVAIYTTTAPSRGDKVWWHWIPEIVIEVVSKSSAKRDYDEKPQEYLEFGVKEYWIIDGFKRRMTVLQRYSGAWKEKIVRPGSKYTTALLPKFSFDLTKVIGSTK